MDTRHPDVAPPLPNHDLLVVSDLHLSEGRLPLEPSPGGRPSPDAGRFSRNEDFFFDEPFARFLDWYRRRAGERGRPLHLVVDGDAFDFLQVIEVGGNDVGERGLGTGPAASVRKLEQIARGHWQFFEALAGFVVDGHALTVIRGNHDVELFHPAVQDRFRALLQEAHVRVRRDPAHAARPTRQAIDEGSVRFAAWFYHEPRLLWIEHGNQYEGANAFRHWLVPLLPASSRRAGEIDLPLGSFFVRYLFNRVEAQAPFADNVKPASRFVWWLLTRHPGTALRFLLDLDGGPLLAFRLWRATGRLGDEAWAEIEAEQAERLGALREPASLAEEQVKALCALRAKATLQETWGARLARYLVPPLVSLVVAAGAGVVVAAAVLVLSLLLRFVLPDALAAPVGRWLAWSAPWHLDAARWGVTGGAFVALVVAGVARARRRWAAWRRHRAAEGGQVHPENLAPAAAGIARAAGVQYVILGHTHEADLRAIGGEGREYFNTGTWTPIFSEGEDRLVRRDVEFAFVHGERTDGGLRMRLLEWEDGAGEPRYLKLFRDRAA